MAPFFGLFFKWFFFFHVSVIFTYFQESERDKSEDATENDDDTSDAEVLSEGRHFDNLIICSIFVQWMCVAYCIYF